MKKITLSVAFLLFGGVYIANAQVGIGTPTPAAASMLDIKADDKGVLIPRVKLSKTTEFSPIDGAQVESLLVYNDAAPVNDVTPGFYYWTPINTKVTPNVPAHWERIVNQTQLDQVISKVGDIDKILALLKKAFPSNNLVNPSTNGDTHGGGMVYIPGNGTTTQPKIEYVYFDGTNYVTKDITADIKNLIKGAESKTTILEFPADSGKFYYISEQTIQKGDGVVPTTPFKSGSTTALEDGVVFLDIPQSVIKNFKTILDGRTTIVKPGTTNEYFTVEEYIQYLSSTVAGNVIYKNIATAGDPDNFVFQYWDGTKYETINLGDIVAANETQTFIKKVVLANGNTQYIYFSEKTIQDWLKASSSNTVANIPDNASGVIVINATSDVVQNFENILKQTTVYKGDTVTIEKIINEIAGKVDGNVIYKNIAATGDPANWVFQYWDGTKYETINLGDIVKANETNTTLVKDAVADLTKPIVYTYSNENFLKGVVGATESKIEITADMVTSITNNEDVQNAITKILNKGGNVYFTRAEIVAGDNVGGTAIPANSFYTVDTNGVKVLINLADLVAGLETKTRITRAVDATDKEVIYSYAHEANKPNASGISTVGTPDVLNVTEDVLYSITNNGDVIDAITNILKQGGNVFFGDHDGDSTTADVLYTVIGGVNTPIDISGTVLEVITNNVQNIKNILGDKIKNTTVTKTGDTYNGGDVYIFASTTDIVANSAVTTGITIPAGTVPNTIIGIKVMNAKGISSNVTDIVITGQKIAFNIGTGNMYNILPVGTYSVIVEFATAAVTP